MAIFAPPIDLNPLPRDNRFQLVFLNFMYIVFQN